MQESTGLLEKICEKNNLCFLVNVNGNYYCSLAYSRRINCKHLGEMDENKLYVCAYKFDLMKDGIK